MIHSPKSWETWEKVKPTITSYRPKQLEPNSNYCCIQYINCNHTSPVCCYPWLEPIYNCCIEKCYKQEVIDVVENEDEVLNRFLKKRSPKCPEYMRGVWWLKDNAVQERLVSLEDADWQTNRYAVKDMRYGWSRDYSCMGGVLLCCVDLVRLNSYIEVSPHDDWVVLSFVGQKLWMKPMNNEVNYSDKWWVEDERGTVGIEKDDMFRVTYSDSLKPTEESTYEYVLKRVAYLDESNTLVKTPHWETFKQRCKEKSERPFYEENSKQIIRFHMDR